MVYAFNATGKTRLSVTYKDLSKEAKNIKGTPTLQHTGVYYNAYSEDIFVWDNDTENSEENIKLTVNHTHLNKFHSNFYETDVREKLNAFNINYRFEFVGYKDQPEKGIKHINFYETGKKDEDDPIARTIKISRAEERTFIWCFFLVLFDVEGWSDEQSSHFFIDDPISSFDEHNIYVTATTLYDLIEKHFQKENL